MDNMDLFKLATMPRREMRLLGMLDFVGSVDCQIISYNRLYDDVFISMQRTPLFAQ